MITIFLVLASVHKCQTGFSLANISFTQNENASWLTFFKGHWFQDLVARYFWRDEIYLALFIFKNNTQMTCYLAKSSVIFIWYPVNYLFYCFEYFFDFYIFHLSVAYLLPHQLLIPPYLVYRHAYVVFICLIWLCLHAFWCFHFFH